MSGHSKWSTIKRQKGVADAKRSQVFTKLAKAIAVAARTSADPSMNFKLRLAIDRARSFSMPKDNIDRAIKKGAGDDDGAKMEEITYEGYGPSGVAFLIEVVTDNRNRTGSNIRHILEKHGGRLAESGSVAWLFEQKGILQIPLKDNPDELELSLIEAGADDIKNTDDNFFITCAPSNFESIKSFLNNQNIIPTYSNIEPTAKTTATIVPETANRLDDLRTALDEDDDVTEFYDNGE